MASLLVPGIDFECRGWYEKKSDVAGPRCVEQQHDRYVYLVLS
jgi:hypothetical protein